MTERSVGSKQVRKTRGGSRGFTLVEVLVSMVLSGVALSVAATDFSHHVRTRMDMGQVAETQQALMAANTFVTQELRQAGACLPELGNFVAMAGEDKGERDVLILRIGTVDAGTVACRRTILTATSGASSSQLTVGDASMFSAGGNIYVTRGGGNGTIFRIASIYQNTLTVEGSLGARFVSGGGVYGLEERRYEVMEIDGRPVLTVSIDGSTPLPMVNGIARFDIKYRLDPCPQCEGIDLPSNNSQWRSVREVELNVAAESERNVGREPLVLDSSTTIRPRNLS